MQEINVRYSLESVDYPTVKPNTFSHIAASYDPINRIVRLYLNGKQVAIDRYTQPLGAYIFYK